ncbi:hypothetical protein TWF481_001340 [Arthrobotrys musiformis]|uniref:F-box domain-containing protein n=1 Tax=Arthrobotrys musiformis TaxID=47236 RepID=A0AAV9WRA1_9PEZI
MAELLEETPVPGLQNTLEGEISEDEDLSLHRTLEDEMAELQHMLDEPLVFVQPGSDMGEGVVMEEEEEDDGIILIGQEKWIFEHERRMLQQEKRMLAHRQKILAQEQRMFDQEGKMLKQERWIIDQRKRLFEGEEDVTEMEERIVQEEKKMEERRSGMDEKIVSVERRITDLERRMSTLKTDKVEAREKNKLTIVNLPAEVQIGILSHLPWQYQMYCFQVFPSWKEAIVLKDTRAKRYIVSEKNYCPRMHKIGASFGWRFVIQDGKIESVTYDLDLSKLAAAETEAEEKEKEFVVDLLQGAVLEDPLFLHEPAEPEKDVAEVDKVAFKVVPCQKKYECLFMKKDEKETKDAEGNVDTKEGETNLEQEKLEAEEYARNEENLTFTFTFEQHPELKNMQIIEFLDWVAKWIGGLEVLKEYKRGAGSNFEIRNIDAPESRKKFKSIFALAVELANFDKWLQQKAFTLLLDELPEVARIMLCTYSKVKLLKVRQEVETGEIEDITEHEELIRKGRLPDMVNALEEKLNIHCESLGKMRSTISDLGANFTELSQEGEVLLHLINDFSITAPRNSKQSSNQKLEPTTHTGK